MSLPFFVLFLSLLAVFQTKQPATQTAPEDAMIERRVLACATGLLSEARGWGTIPAAANHAT